MQSPAGHTRPRFLLLSMIRNYLVVGFRAFRRQRLFGFINVFGLAVGLACALLIALYVRHEWAYDRHHPDADRLYRLTSEIKLAGEQMDLAVSAAAVGLALQEADAGVEAVARLLPADPIVRVGTETFLQERTFYADPAFFDVFSLAFVEGSAAQALTAPGQAVLTESTARRYFGEASAMGQTVKLGPQGEPFEVVGVVPDVPEATHLRYSVLASMRNVLPEEPQGPEAWISNVNYLTYLRVRPGTDPSALDARMAALIEAQVGEMMRQFNAVYRVRLQPVTAIHLGPALANEPAPGGSRLYVYVFLSVALIVLLIASINFTNLATARALDRAREVGLRKALGAERRQVGRQFLAESFVVTLLAAALAVGIAWLLLPAFNSLTGRALTPVDTLGTVGWLLLGVPLVALVAGAYPAFVLSAFRPAETLRGRFRSSRSGLVLRRGLVVTQFTLSVVLVAGSFVVQRQLAYARTQGLGFNREQVVILPLRPDEGIRAQEHAFKAAVLESSAIVSATLTDQYPSGGNESNSLYLPAGKPDDAGVSLKIYTADFDLLETLGLEVTDGRALDAALPTDSSAFLVNETAARLLGFSQVEGAQLVEIEDGPDGPRVLHPVAGFVRDFHFDSFHHAIRPLLFRVGEPGFRYDYLLARVQPGQMDAALTHLEKAWGRFSSGTPMDARFLDQQFEALYQSDRQLGRAFGYFTMLAILIACLGLLGLSAYATEQRRKEIGVRKVLGAGVPGLVALLARDFARPVALAVVLGAPLAYFAAARWLESFAYQAPLTAVPFVLAGVLALTVALVTVGLYTLRAARANPVETLRAE